MEKGTLEPKISEHKIKLISELCGTPEHVIEENLKSGKRTISNSFIWGASQMFDLLMESRFYETEESLYKSLMSRFEKCYHATEHVYAKEAAKMFAWMINSWKQEENYNNDAWMCQKCGNNVPNEQVTFEEYHDGCGGKCI